MPNKYEEEAIAMLRSMAESVGSKRPAEQFAQYTSSALKTGAGIAALFQEAPKVEMVNATYQKNPNIAAAAAKALMDAESNQDDYAARIRAREGSNRMISDAIANSGGQRGFVAAQTSAAADAFNTANLEIDKRVSQEKTAKMGVAANLQQLELFDELNRARDIQQANEINTKIALSNIESERKRVSGAADLIFGGLTDLAKGISTGTLYGKDGVITNKMRLDIANAMALMGQQIAEKEEVVNEVEKVNSRFGQFSQDNTGKGPVMYQKPVNGQIRQPVFPVNSFNMSQFELDQFEEMLKNLG